MNKREVLQMLEQFLGAFRCHSLLAQELSDIIAGSGYESSFRMLLISRLHTLAAMGKTASTLDGFELLRHSGGEVYSMHLEKHSKFNIRILYLFLPNNEPVLLHAFYERSGKRKTDYTNSILITQSRFAEERSAYENEQP